MQLRVAICEDDKIIGEDTQRRILEIKSDYVIDIYSTGEELLLTDKGYDIVFLDIEHMPFTTWILHIRNFSKVRRTL